MDAALQNWRDVGEDLGGATATGEPVDQHNVVNRHFKPILEGPGIAAVRSAV